MKLYLLFVIGSRPAEASTKVKEGQPALFPTRYSELATRLTRN